MYLACSVRRKFKLIVHIQLDSTYFVFKTDLFYAFNLSYSLYFLWGKFASDFLSQPSKSFLVPS